jgi:hypothetical protein
MSDQGKSFKKIILGVLLFRNRKGTFIFTFLCFLISRNASNGLLFIFLIDSGLKQPQIFEQVMTKKS